MNVQHIQINTNVYKIYTYKIGRTDPGQMLIRANSPRDKVNQAENKIG